jgi:hypothetical protein
MFITSAEKFVEWFRLQGPGAYRDLTSRDTRDMTKFGLIGRYGFYITVGFGNCQGCPPK